MLVVEDYFKTFIIKEIADASKVTESMIALSMENKQKVDEMLAKAIEA
jgi:predicted lactoylglutathione lyase